jgi:NTE family protein
MKNIRPRALRAVCALTLTLAVVQPPLAAQEPEKKRKKIGLVLAGGSALGLTHLGVLKWLEEHHIPVDVVAGTSMGGLVGGVFATGRNTAEREQFVRSIDWTAALASEPSYVDLSFRRKEDRRAYPTILEFGLKKGIRLPPALSSGHGVGLVLSRVAAPYAGMKTFDDLPTPFRCIGADLIEAKPKVFADGNLFDALRSTMSLPGIFPTWEVNGHVYADGGMLNNLPVDVVRDLGAEVIIAVPLIDPKPKRETLETILGVANRSLTLMIDETEKRHLKLANVLVEPDIEGFTGSEFDQWEKFSQLGYEAAERRRSDLIKYAVSESEWRAWVENRRKRRRPDQITPALVTLDHPDERANRVLQHYVGGVAGEPLNEENLGHGLTRMAGIGRYQALDYYFSKKDGKDEVVVRAHEKPHAPPILNTVLDIDGASGQKIRFGAAARLTFLDIGSPGSEWRTDASIGVVNLLSTEYYWRIHGTRWFAAPRGVYRQEDVPHFVDGQRDAEYKLRQRQFGADLGFAFNRFAEFRAGYEFDNVRTTVETGSPIPSLQGDFHSFRARLGFDNHDSPLVPRDGARAFAEYRRVFNSSLVARGFNQFEARLTWAKSFSAKNSVIVGGAGGIRPDEIGSFPVFPLGGTLRVSSLARNQLLGSRYYQFSGYILRSLLQKQSFSFVKLYLAPGYEMGRAYFVGDSGKPYHSGNLAAVAETPLGVVMIGGAIGDKGERKFFFRLGRVF